MFDTSIFYLIEIQAFQLCSTGEDGFNLSYESLTNKEARKLLLEYISKDQAFYQSLIRIDQGGKEMDQGSTDDDEKGEEEKGGKEGIVCDEIDSSVTIKEAIQVVLNSSPAGSLADIYLDKKEISDGSDDDNGSMGLNMDSGAIVHSSKKDVVNRLMELYGE